MHALRVWGGGVYEQEVFYEICDELGKNMNVCEGRLKRLRLRRRHATAVKLDTFNIILFDTTCIVSFKMHSHRSKPGL